MASLRLPLLKILVAFLWCFTIVSVQVAEARELKVLDETGLIRSIKSVEESASVTVLLEAEDGQTLHLSRIDGVGETLQQIVSKNEVRFKDLPAGIWRVEGNPRQIRSVRIESK